MFEERIRKNIFSEISDIEARIANDKKYAPDEDCPSMKAFWSMLGKEYALKESLLEKAFEIMPCDYCTDREEIPHDEQVIGHCEACLKALCCVCLSLEQPFFHKSCEKEMS